MESDELHPVKTGVKLMVVLGASSKTTIFSMGISISGAISVLLTYTEKISSTLFSFAFACIIISALPSMSACNDSVKSLFEIIAVTRSTFELLSDFSRLISSPFLVYT